MTHPHRQQPCQRVLPGHGGRCRQQIPQGRAQQSRDGHRSGGCRRKGHSKGSDLAGNAAHCRHHSPQERNAARCKAVIVLQGIPQPARPGKPAYFRHMLHHCFALPFGIKWLSSIILPPIPRRILPQGGVVFGPLSGQIGIFSFLSGSKKAPPIAEPQPVEKARFGITPKRAF